MEIIQALYGSFESIFWSEKFWLPHNATWADFKNDIIPGMRHPQPYELVMAIPIALFMLVLRFVVERVIMKPTARLLGVRETRQQRPENIPKLDLFFKANRRPNEDEILSLATELDLPERRVQRWFRIRRNQRKFTVMTKFCECGWRFTFHVTSFCYGLYVLYDEPFFRNTDLIIDMPTWPHHHIKPEFYNYYLLTLSFWTSVIMSLFTDVRRHDFIIMAVHHILTCCLIALSWSMNYVRVGMLVLITHDFADCFLELCKMTKYAKKEAISNLLFILFFLSWVASRLYFFPRYIIYVCWYKYIEYYYESIGGHVVAVLAMIVFLTVLFMLHLIWTGMIARLVYELVFEKEWVDHRSDSDPEESTDGSHGDTNGSAVYSNGKKQN